MTMSRLRKFRNWGTGTVLGLMLTSQVNADITAKKFGLGLDKAIIHSDITTEHYLRSVNQENGLIKQEPRIRFLPTVGIKLFDEALDIYAVGYFDRTQNNTTVEPGKQARLYFESKPWTFAKVFTFQPFVLHKFPALGKDATTLFAATQAVSNSYNTSLGKITPAFGVELGSNITAKTQESDYEVESGIEDAEILGLGLRKDDSGSVKGVKKHQDFYHEWFASLAVIPSTFSNLTLSLKTWFANEYAPAYRVKAGGKEEGRYVLTQFTSERIRVTYKINDRFSLKNDFSAFQQGPFEGRLGVGEDSFLNEFGLIYTIL